MTWHLVAEPEEIAPGRPKIVEVAGKEIGVFHEGGEYHAVLNFCPHAGAPVCLGKVTGRVTCDDAGRLAYDAEARTLRCPWHHWEFDLATGRAVAPIRQKLKTYPARLTAEGVEVEL